MATPKNSQAYEVYQLASKGKSQKEVIELTGIKPRNVQWYWSVYGLNQLPKQQAKN